MRVILINDNIKDGNEDNQDEDVIITREMIISGNGYRSIINLTLPAVNKKQAATEIT